MSYAELQVIRDYINKLSDNVIKLPDGLPAYSDYYEFIKLVDRFASNYGMGGCRSIGEFAEMLDNEDPVLLRALDLALTERLAAKNGNKKFKPTINNNKKKSNSYVYKIGNKTYTVAQVNDLQMMKRFLLDFGHVDPKRLKEAEEKILSGKIQMKEGINFTSGDLLKPNFNLKGALKSMNEADKDAINFRITGKDIFGRKR